MVNVDCNLCIKWTSDGGAIFFDQFSHGPPKYVKEMYHV